MYKTKRISISYIRPVLTFLRHIWSFILGVKLHEYHSRLSGRLELWLINGHKVLNSENTNYSFDSLHRVFQKAFRELQIEKTPPENVLILGFGAGSVASILRHEYHFQCCITGVDADPLLLQIADEHFGMQASPLLQLHCADAAGFIATDTNTYDLIVTDVFIDIHVPESVTEAEFFHNCYRALKPGGTFLMNIITTEAAGQKQCTYAHKLWEQLGGNTRILNPLPGNMVLCFRKHIA